MGVIKVPLFVKLLFSTLQKLGRLVLWEAVFILKVHSAETQVFKLHKYRNVVIISKKLCKRETELMKKKVRCSFRCVIVFDQYGILSVLCVL